MQNALLSEFVIKRVQKKEQESHRLFKGESVQNLGSALNLKKKTEAQMEELRSPADYCFSECASKSNNGFYSHLSANSTVSSSSNLSKIHTKLQRDSDLNRSGRVVPSETTNLY